MMRSPTDAWIHDAHHESSNRHAERVLYNAFESTAAAQEFQWGAHHLRGPRERVANAWRKRTRNARCCTRHHPQTCEGDRSWSCKVRRKARKAHASSVKAARRRKA